MRGVRCVYYSCIARHDRTIVIDPGESVGVAVFSGTRLDYAYTSTLPHRGLRELLQEHTGPVVCERAPILHRHNDAATSRVERIVEQEALDVYYVSPSQWKGHPWSTLMPEDRGCCATRHERDAVCLGRWYLRAKGHNAIDKAHAARLR